MLIPKSVFSVSRLCGMNPGRSALNHVKIVRTKDGPLAIATNEHSMVIAAWQEQDAKDFPKCDGSAKQVKGFDRLIPAETWAEASGMIPRKRMSLQSALLDETKKDETLFCTHDLNAPKTIRTLPPKDAAFPDLDQLRQTIPVYAEDEATRVAVDPKRLAELLSTIASCTANDQALVILEVPKDSKRPIVVKDCQGPGVQAIGALMPSKPEKAEPATPLKALGKLES